MALNNPAAALSRGRAISPAGTGALSHVADDNNGS